MSITNSWSLLKLMSIESVMPFNHLIHCCSFLHLTSIFPKSGSFPVSQFFAPGGQSTSFSFNISPPSEHSGLISLRMDWLEFLAVQETLKASPTTQFKGINSSVISFPYNATLTSIHDHWKNHSLD